MAPFTRLVDTHQMALATAHAHVCTVRATIHLRLAVWRNGSVVRRMNEVTLRRARLVLGWVTVFGQVYHLGM